MVARAAEQMPPGSTDFLPPIQRAFEAIGFAEGLQRARRTRSVSAISVLPTP